jgi:hypothetical protein
MCTRSGRHASASHASNSASRRIPSEQYSSPRNTASRIIPRSAPTSSSCQDIMKATATARHRQVLWKEPEDDRAVAACHHVDTPDNSGQLPQARQQRLNKKLKCRSASTMAGVIRLLGDRGRGDQGHGGGPQRVLQGGLGCGLQGARNRTRHAETPSDVGERYRDTRHQSNVCNAELLDQSSSASDPVRRVFPGQSTYECARQDSNPRPAA